MLYSLINLNYVHHFISCEKYILAFKCIINKSTTCIHFVYAYGRNLFIILIFFQEEILFTVMYACFIFYHRKNNLKNQPNIETFILLVRIPERI